MRLNIASPHEFSNWPSPAGEVRLAPGEVHIWWVGLRVQGAALCACWDSLPEEEARQASNYRFAKDLREFVVRRAVLRQLLAGYSGRRAAELLFDFRAGGKPALRNMEDLHFTMSHASDLAVLAIARNPVGIDLEHVQKDLFGQTPFGQALIEQCLSDREQCYVRALPAGERNRALYRCWTRKEAVLKAVGTGLLYPPQQLSVIGETKRTCGVSLFNRNWLIRQVAAPRGYVAALAMEEPTRRIACRSRKFPANTFFGHRKIRDSARLPTTLEPRQIPEAPVVSGRQEFWR